MIIAMDYWTKEQYEEWLEELYSKEPKIRE